MKMFKNEIYKLFTSRLFLFGTAAALILCVYSSFAADPVGVSGGEYKAFYSETENMSAEEVCEYIETEKREILSAENFDYETFKRLQFFDGQREYFESLRDYKSYLESIKTAAENVTAVSIFADKNSYTYKNAVKTPPAYEKVAEVVPQSFPSEGILLAADSPVCDILLIFPVLAAVIVLTLKERETGIFGLIKPLKNGRGKLALVKAAVIFSVSFFGGILIYGGALSVGVIRFGGGDMTLPVQSLKGFTGCSLPINICEALIIIFAVKIISAFFCGMIFMCLCAKLPEIAAYAAGIAIAAAEVLAYILIFPSSYLALFKGINIAAVVDCAEILKMYGNLNLFGTPVNTAFAAIAFLAAGIIFTIIFEVKFLSSVSVSAIKKAEIILPFSRRVPKKAFAYSLHKTFLTHKGILVIFAVLAIQIYSGAAYRKPYDADDGYYHFYCDKIAALDENAADEFVYSENERFEQLEAALFSPESGENAVYASDELKAKNGFIKAKQQYEYLKNLNSNNKAMFYQTGWKEIFGVNGYKKDMNLALIGVAALCLTVTAAAAYDNKCRIGFILFCTKFGRKKYAVHNFLTSAIAAALTAFAVYVPYFVSVLSAYETDGIEFSVRCISEYERFWDVPIWGYLIFLFLARIFTLLLVSAIMMFISARSKSPSAAMLVSAVIFALPIMLYTAGLEAIIGFCAPLSVNREVIESNFVGVIVYTLFAAGLAFGMMSKSKS
ncbi:MAG: hypothetical protein NC452_14875 [Eubacterium sp.]|nr:hypothetical protein [Eubacterium sp.]